MPLSMFLSACGDSWCRLRFVGDDDGEASSNRRFEGGVVGKKDVMGDEVEDTSLQTSVLDRLSANDAM